ncbi:MAG: replicative DNA helicase [Anaerolineae bacterium]|nr:replicative DNA helicase [Anaerolineae bacterium]
MADVLPPNHIEAEEAVLGSLMIDPSATPRVASFLRPSDFYVVKHGWIYSAIQACGNEADLLTVAANLASQNLLEEVGGEGYLAQIMASVPTALNVEAYGHLVEDMALRRRMLNAAGDVAKLAYDTTKAIQQVIEQSEATIFGVSEQRMAGQMVPMKKAVDDFFTRIEYLHEHKDEPLGIPTGFNEVDRMLGGLQRGDLLIIAARPGVGKCVAADTQLFDPTTGKLVRAEDAVRARKANVVTLDAEYKLTATAASDFIDDGVKPLYRVQTALGREIKVTASHPFLTMSGWQALMALKVGDQIAVPRCLPFFGNDDAPEHQVKALAYLLADGCVTKATPQFTNSNPLLRDDFRQAALAFPGTSAREFTAGRRTPNLFISGDSTYIRQARQQFGERLSVHLQRKHWSQAQFAQQVGVSRATVSLWVNGHVAPGAVLFEQLCRVLEVAPVVLAPDGLGAMSEKAMCSLAEWLTSLGVMGKAAAEKFVPECVFGYTRPKLALFLNRLFACDGSIYRKSDQAGVSYSTVSLKLARDVQHLLLRFGIIARLRDRKVKYKGEQRQAYELQITGQAHVVRFIDEIGAFGKDAAASYGKATFAGKPSNPNNDVIPREVWGVIDDVRGDRSWRSMFKDMGLSPDSNLHVGQRSPSRQRLLQIGTALNSEPLKQLAESDVYWDKITKIEFIGEQQVYDLTIPETHNFVANDMLVHNTSLMLNLGYNASFRHRQRVAIFSLEMGNEQLVQRFVSTETGIEGQRLRTGTLSDDEWGRMSQVCLQMSEMPMFLDDSPSLSPLDLRVKARRIYQEHGLDLIIVDYLQLMQGDSKDGKGGENRVQEISHISRSLKQIARELKVPLIAGSQLSRTVEQRSDKRPMLSDLRESGCLAGDTLVTLGDGARVPIRDLVEKSEFDVLALAPSNLKLSMAKVSRAFCTGVKPIYEMVTRLGRRIKATANHKFCTIQGWQRLDTLDKGMHIALPRQIDCASTQSMTNEALALLGHLIGDGCTLPKHVIQYTTREADLAQIVFDLAQKVFGDEVAPRIKHERNWFQVYLTSTRSHTHHVRSAVAEWLDQLGVWGLRSPDKRVPQALFSLPTSSLAVFMRHLWATDGCIRMPSGQSRHPVIYYASSSQQLAQDVQSLLLRFGINAKIRRVSQKDKGRDQYHVRVTGKSDLLTFCKKIGAVGQYKTESLSAIEHFIATKTENTNRDVIPSEIWERIVVPTMRNRHISHRQLHERLNMAYSGMTIFKQNVSRDRASRVANAIDSQELQQLASSDIYWDEIVAVTPCGEEEVFDLTVPGPHNFVANDIFVHNSIEQDADIVSFIYRDEMYNPDTEFKNIAELIIAKNRNGPTGKVDLFFDKSLTAFRNLARERVNIQ